MPWPRKAQASVVATPYYHCVSGCVRRAFLCGEDTHTGTSYAHRKQWIQDRMIALAQQFAVDICAYAVIIIITTSSSMSVASAHDQNGHPP